MADITELVKIAIRPRYSLAILLTALAILLIPLPKALYLDSIRKDFGQYLGIIAVLFIFVWAIEVFLMWWGNYKEQRQLIDYLSSLNEGETLLLAHAVLNNEQTVVILSDHDTTLSLEGKGLIKKLSDKGQYFSKPYLIADPIWKKLCSPRFRFLERVRMKYPHWMSMITTPPAS